MSNGLDADFSEAFKYFDGIVDKMRVENSDEHIITTVIPEIIASEEVGTITVETVLGKLHSRLGLLDPERFTPVIEQMIQIDSGKGRGIQHD